MDHSHDSKVSIIDNSFWQAKCIASRASQGPITYMSCFKLKNAPLFFAALKIHVLFCSCCYQLVELAELLEKTLKKKTGGATAMLEQY